MRFVPQRIIRKTKPPSAKPKAVFSIQLGNEQAVRYHVARLQ